MTATRSNHNMFNQLMQINQQAFEQGHYEVAYHILAAAFHCGLLLQEQAVLDVLEQRALQQRDWIDTHAPSHPLSSESASSKGHAGVYTSVLRQIQTRKLMQQTTPPHPDRLS